MAADPREKAADESRIDQRYQHFLALLLPLDRVRQDRESHPEGDVLYHSLQVFELARENVRGTRNCCWRRSCTTLVKALIRRITWQQEWRCFVAGFLTVCSG
ncbi:MAG UNVERIFIED_CONTAM: hypothetical protein LVR18_15705 [Planctomycetaceae bacterium]|jgi:hypothetical protein